MSEHLIDIFLPLAAAHLVVDFVVQSDADVEGKSRLSVVALLKHASQHALLAYALCGQWGMVWIPLGVFVTHLAIDVLKELAGRIGAGGGWARKLWTLFIDQGAHVAALLGLTWVLDPWLRAGAWHWEEALGLSPVVLVVAIGYVVAVDVGGRVVGLRIEPFLSQLAGGQNERETGRGLGSGGEMIGKLERLLILVFMLVRFEGGVGFLIAAKSIFRFGELRDPESRMEAEYIIIGTFMSFAWAVIAGWLARYAMDSLLAATPQVAGPPGP